MNVYAWLVDFREANYGFGRSILATGATLEEAIEDARATLAKGSSSSSRRPAEFDVVRVERRSIVRRVA